MDENIDSPQPRIAPVARTRTINDVGMLDLLYVKSVDDLADVASIHDIGLLIIRESMQKALAGIDLRDVGGIATVPDNAVNILSGQVTITGEALASGAADCSLVVAGQLFVTSPALSVGYKEIRVYGQLFATRGSETAILPKITHLSGQNFFIPENPRFLKGDSRINQRFLELLPEPQPLVIIGVVTFEEDVSEETLNNKVPEIVLMGRVEAPRHLIPLLEVLTREKMGVIEATS